MRAWRDSLSAHSPYADELLTATGPVKRSHAPLLPSRLKGVLRWERQSSTRFRESFALGILGVRALTALRSAPVTFPDEAFDLT
jgi:hypothetical protein